MNILTNPFVLGLLIGCSMALYCLITGYCKQNALKKEIANLLTLRKPLLVLPSTYYSSRWQLLWLVTAQITLDSLCRATQFSPLQLAQKTYKRNHTLYVPLYLPSFIQHYVPEIHPHSCVLQYFISKRKPALKLQHRGQGTTEAQSAFRFTFC